MRVLFALAALLALGVPLAQAAQHPVLVTGATGGTGALVYLRLKARGHSVRALVRSAEKARKVLNCSRCDVSDGIFIADVTRPSSLGAAFKGAESVVILTASHPIKLPNGSWGFPDGGYPVDLDWHGVVNQAVAARDAGAARVLLVSSMGTTEPNSFLDLLGGGQALFYKTQGELALMTIPGLNYTVVKPSGLLDAHGGGREILVGRFDRLARTGKMTIPRADVAAVIVGALEMPEQSGNLWFDCSSDPSGKPTTDFAALFDRARDSWRDLAA
ncbi:hypothetical protein T492DRAFT_1032632 [Pavlovales sp. CCMP2436]|nr:hypothetical protein T492DRAFT_1032632 [Pavlovales sp. CCMP2436]|mmetsp:Transcript_45085/g.111772  ORF Transcript_45085/g.111772 Transcript_45085/m.111772 type:complete len:273 (-) Transcript_45085:143-961(-)